jgi:hypothetical protein
VSSINGFPYWLNYVELCIIMKLIKKNGYKTLDEIKIDLQKTFSHIISNEGDFYFVTITKNQSPHARDLNFQITNGLFNRIWKDYKHSREFTNYLFVIEYPEAISKIDKPIDKLNQCNVHSHILINTTLSKTTLNYYLNTTFKQADIKKELINKRIDKTELINYFIKQIFLEDDCYNYKAIILKPKKK